MTQEQVVDAIGEVLSQNRDRVAQIGSNRMGSMTGVVDGVRYQLGLNRGHIGQFFPLAGEGWTMNSRVEIYIKTDEGFTQIHKYVGGLTDSSYIGGAISCKIDGQDLITLEHWDLVDQLWAYIIEALIRVSSENEYDGYFPDQPLRLRFVPLSKDIVEVTIGKKSMRINRHILVSTLAKGAVHFFEQMNRLVPEKSATWNEHRREAEELVKVYGDTWKRQSFE